MKGYNKKSRKQLTDAKWHAVSLLRFVLLVLIATIFLFLLVHTLPGDAATQKVGQFGQEEVDLAREEMGLTKPIYSQYVNWLKGVVKLDLGLTLAANLEVKSILYSPLKATALLALIVYLGLLLVTLPLTLFFTSRDNSIADKIFSGVSVSVIAVPEFVTSIALLAFFSQFLKVLPVLSKPSAGLEVYNSPISFVMPAISLWLICSSTIYRRMGALISTYSKTAYVIDARLAGVSEIRVLFCHLLPSAASGIAQLYAQVIPYLLGGSVAVETVTSFPGMGHLLVQSIGAREVPLVMAIGTILIIISAVAFTVSDVFKKKSERFQNVV